MKFKTVETNKYVLSSTENQVLSIINPSEMDTVPCDTDISFDKDNKIILSIISYKS